MSVIGLRQRAVRVGVAGVVALAAWLGVRAYFGPVWATQDLIRAVRRVDVAAAKRALDRGADANAMATDEADQAPTLWERIRAGLHIGPREVPRNGECVLHLALDQARAEAQNGMQWAASGQLVRLLLQRGADPNIRYGSGRTPLFDSVFSGEDEMVQVLLEHGADPNLDDFGPQHLRPPGPGDPPNSYAVSIEAHLGPPHLNGPGQAPLCAAAWAGNVRVAKLLLARGADPNWRYRDGTTALMFAVSARDVEMVRLLLDGGADAGASTTDGETLVGRARRYGEQKVTRLLLDSVAHATQHGDSRLTPTRRH